MAICKRCQGILERYKNYTPKEVIKDNYCVYSIIQVIGKNTEMKSERHFITKWWMQ
ncbi:hypothetical protein [Methanotorris formicicus]|uniref:hypothetical protein n=1 Tax=Methanotorris formicicus TaxID=213185 RepID=UPI00131F2337|nr:hypothetical protein [Methanotorris formicicus]